MSINTLTTNEVADHNKLISDAKSDDDRLSIPESRKNGERAAAYEITRNRQSDAEIHKLETQTDADDMLAELELLERIYING